jgi:metal-responsive CopG/Arc/MetJ family transcriptional regulator
MPETFLVNIDKVANEENRSRSELIREALRTYINKQNTINKYISNPIAEQNANTLEKML